jgi:hypothetical protein
VDKLAGGLTEASQSRIIVAGVLLLLTLISGVWLSSAGRPLNVPIFTGHKLIALAATVLIALAIYGLRGNVDGRAVVWVAIVATGLLLLSLFASGALLSAGKPVDAALLALHRVAPVLAPVAAAVTIYLLTSGR